jgi:hypothetical protein
MIVASLIALIAIAAALVMIAPVGGRVLAPVGPTTYRRFASTDPGPGCGDDRTLRMLVGADVAYVPCSPDPAGLPRGGLIRLDPVRARIDALALPSGAPQWFEAQAALPSADGARVAFVYAIGVPEGRTSTRMGGLAIVIVEGASFWRPALELTEEHAQVLGMAWDGDDVELALRIGPNEGPVEIVRVGRNGAPDHTRVEIGEICGELTSCWARAAHRVEGSWRYLLGGIAPGGETHVWDGARTEAPRPIVRPEGLGLDATAAGVPMDSAPSDVGLTLLDGEWRPFEGPSSSYVDHYEAIDGRLRAIVMGSGSESVTRELDGRPRTLLCYGATLSIDGRDVATHAPACNALMRGARLRRWLVSPRGEAIELDGAARADPLGVFEHVYAVSPGAYWRLWFMLLGFPVLLVIGAGVGAMTRRRPLGTVIGAAVAAIVFVVLAYTWASERALFALP